MSFYIWWLSQRECETVLACNLSDSFPEWLQSEINSLSGRAGRGRLWVSPKVREFAGIEGIEWEEEAPLSDECGVRAGVVLRHRDLRHVLGLPGFVTDEALEPIDITRVDLRAQGG